MREDRLKLWKQQKRLKYTNENLENLFSFFLVLRQEIVVEVHRYTVVQVYAPFWKNFLQDPELFWTEHDDIKETAWLHWDSTYLNFALGFHKLQFGLCKLQLHLSQLLLQCILLIICFYAFILHAYSRQLQCPLLTENLTAVFAGHHFTLKYPESSFLIHVTEVAVLPGRAVFTLDCFSVSNAPII